MKEHFDNAADRLRQPKKTNKDRTIPLRVTQQQYATIKSKAMLAGYSVSEYLRRLGIGHPVEARFDKDEKRNLVGIGRNLNQLAAYANNGFFYHKPIMEVLEQLKRILVK